MSVITTEYIPSTSFKGSKFRARLGKLQLITPYDYSLQPYENHFKVAKMLLERENIASELTMVGSTTTGYKFTIGPLRYLVRYPNEKPEKGFFGHRRMIVTAKNPTEALAIAHDILFRSRGYHTWDLKKFKLDKANSTDANTRFNNLQDSRACAYTTIEGENN